MKISIQIGNKEEWNIKTKCTREKEVWNQVEYNNIPLSLFAVEGQQTLTANFEFET